MKHATDKVLLCLMWFKLKYFCVLLYAQMHISRELKLTVLMKYVSGKVLLCLMWFKLKWSLGMNKTVADY